MCWSRSGLLLAARSSSKVSLNSCASSEGGDVSSHRCGVFFGDAAAHDDDVLDACDDDENLLALHCPLSASVNEFGESW